jgi:hypothetical protein
LRGDAAAAQLAERQLEWTLGRNPLCRSFMYGEGYDYLPLYSPMCGDIVGALPVGLPSFGAKDEPYWKAGSNEPSPKEQWVQTVTRFVGLVSEVLGPAELTGRARSLVQVRREHSDTVATATPDAAGEFHHLLAPGPYLVTMDGLEHRIVALPGGSHRIDSQLAFTVASTVETAGRVQVEVVARGTGSHTFALRTSNAAFSERTHTVVLSPGQAARLVWSGTVESPNSPCYVVVVPDGDISRRQEATLPASRR